jgi:putative GTP pyrophosphokinase
MARTTKIRPPSPPEAQIARLLESFASKEHLVSGFLDAVLGHIKQSKPLSELVHSVKYRVKDKDHLKDKLARKAKEALERGKPFLITPENLLRKITDLAGIRLLHLHTSQFGSINAELRSIFSEQKFRLIEGPFARTWDDEYREYFKSVGAKPQKSPRMYTSVHYVIESGSQTTVTCEIQVRTLMEEVWGEVDHKLNYPRPAEEVSCVEQIRALARVTSSATRLVDSIFATVADIERQKQQRAQDAPKGKETGEPGSR